MLEDLRQYESKVLSQFGEDGVLEHIFEVIGETNRSFVEFGAWDGEHLSNTANLRLHKGWSGLLMEGSDRADGTLVKREFVSAENVEALFDKHGVPEGFDLLSIDIDGNDYWVWKAIERYRPRVVVVEYNIFFDLRDAKTIEYRADHIWDETPYHSASLAAFEKLGRAKGYTLVHTDTWSPNAFFIANEALPAGYVQPPLNEIAGWNWEGLTAPPGTEDRSWVEV